MKARVAQKVLRHIHDVKMEHVETGIHPPIRHRFKTTNAAYHTERRRSIRYVLTHFIPPTPPGVNRYDRASEYIWGPEVIDHED